MSSWAVSTLRRVAADIQSFEDGRLPHDAPDTFSLYLELVYREILVQEQLNGDSLIGRAGTLVSRALENIRSLQDSQLDEQQSRMPATLHSGSVGRPKFDIPQQQLSFLVESGFTGPQIASILGVSLRTVRRRMVDYGLSMSDEYADILDSDLEHLVMEIKAEFPTCGQKQMMGHLKSRGYRVQQVRVREVMRRVDPEGSVMRHLSAVNRRRYSVPAPGHSSTPTNESRYSPFFLFSLI